MSRNKGTGLTRVGVALGVTAALGALIVSANLLMEEPFSSLAGTPMVLAVALWAAIDSHRLELNRYRCGLDHPVGVFFCVGLLWPVFLPAYLLTRSRRLGGELLLKERYREPDRAGAADAAEPVGPRLWVRATLIGALWLPVFVMVALYVPGCEPVFQKLSEEQELPELSRWVMAFSWFDRACFHVPTVLAAVVPFAVAEAVMRVLRKRSWGPLWLWCWVVAVALASIPATLLIVAALLLPVFVMGSRVQ